MFQKSKTEIDEVLFVQYMYKEAKRVLKATFAERIAKAQEQKETETNPDTIKNIDARIAQNSLHYDTVGICMFYFMSLYYEFKAQFDVKNDTRIFNYERIYADKEYKKKLTDMVANLFLTLTVKILVKTATEANKSANVNNWVRSYSCEEKFFEALREEMASDMDLETKYKNFVDEYKISYVK